MCKENNGDKYTFCFTENSSLCLEFFGGWGRAIVVKKMFGFAARELRHFSFTFHKSLPAFQNFKNPNILFLRNCYPKKEEILTKNESISFYCIAGV
jgi:hypothetical protein